MPEVLLRLLLDIAVSDECFCGVEELDSWGVLATEASIWEELLVVRVVLLQTIVLIDMVDRVLSNDVECPEPAEEGILLVREPDTTAE